ncbi:hypothetical protein Daci_1423 [Delftia acidovorans SPH-1]|uniref:Uncharacterized protein n=1 Tax=Delftia acidovorans (strain DSM 14801 / SPH-1) TaxID=398578 RepID=A9BSR2_DELAS|nr:hypothetical protein Daci_1423 [Delftia acidovorans SPH-1]
MGELATRLDGALAAGAAGRLQRHVLPGAEFALAAQARGAPGLDGELARCDDAAGPGQVAVDVARTDGDVLLRLDQAFVGEIAAGVDVHRLGEGHVAPVADGTVVRLEPGLAQEEAVAFKAQVLRRMGVEVAGHVEVAAKADAASLATGGEPALRDGGTANGNVTPGLQSQVLFGRDLACDGDGAAGAGKLTLAQLQVAAHAHAVRALQARIAQRGKAAAHVDGTGLGLDVHAVVDAQLLAHGEALAGAGIEPAGDAHLPARLAARSLAVALARTALQACIAQHQGVAGHGNASAGIRGQALAEGCICTHGDVRASGDVGRSLDGGRACHLVAASRAGLVGAAGLQALQADVAARVDHGSLAVGRAGHHLAGLGIGAGLEAQRPRRGHRAGDRDGARARRGVDAGAHQVALDAQGIVGAQRGLALRQHAAGVDGCGRNVKIGASLQAFGLEGLCRPDVHGAHGRDVARHRDVTACAQLQVLAGKHGPLDVDLACGQGGDAPVGDQLAPAGDAAVTRFQAQIAAGLQALVQADGAA